jgi:hypothetical protein
MRQVPRNRLKQNKNLWSAETYVSKQDKHGKHILKIWEINQYNAL